MKLIRGPPHSFRIHFLWKRYVSGKNSQKFDGTLPLFGEERSSYRNWSVSTSLVGMEKRLDFCSDNYSWPVAINRYGRRNRHVAHFGNGRLPKFAYENLQWSTRIHINYLAFVWAKLWFSLDTRADLRVFFSGIIADVGDVIFRPITIARGLPSAVRSSPSLSVFKRSLENFLFTKSYGSWTFYCYVP